MKVIDKQSGCAVTVVGVEGNPDVEVMIDGVVNYRKVSELDFTDPSLNLNSTVVVSLTHEGAFHLNKKGIHRKDGQKWKTGDDFVTILWRLFPLFSKYLHSGGDAPFKKLRAV